MIAIALAAALDSAAVSALADRGRQLQMQRQRDPFAAGAAAAEAQAFEVFGRLADGNSTGFAGSSSSGSWSYDPERQTLKVLIVGETMEDTANPLSYFDGLIIGARRIPLGGYLGESNFGVRRKVVRERWEVNAVQASQSFNLQFEGHYPPAEAKAIVSTLKIRIKGVTRPWSQASATRCSSRYLGATVDSPEDITVSTCVVGADLQEVALVSAAGPVKVWDLTPNTAGLSPPPAFDPRNPPWVRKPTAEDFARYYPDRAQRNEVAGSVALRCTVNERGTLDMCSVQSETPNDVGFGDAAMKLSKLYKSQPPSAPMVVDVILRFELPKSL